MRLLKWIRDWVGWFVSMYFIARACSQPNTIYACQYAHHMLKLQKLNNASHRIRDELEDYPKRQFWPWEVKKAQRIRRERERIITEETMGL